MRRNGNVLILPTTIPNKASEEQNVMKFVCLYEQNVKFVISRGNCIANEMAYYTHFKCPDQFNRYVKTTRIQS